MFVQVARAIGCNVIAVVKRDEQVVAAKQMGAHEIIQTTKAPNIIEAVRALTPQKRGCDVVIEAVGRPEAWEWAVEMVRKGGTVNFFGGCASGSKVQLDTNRLHYSEITLKATFHHTPETVRRAFGLIAAKKIRPTDYITGEAPLSSLQTANEPFKWSNLSRGMTKERPVASSCESLNTLRKCTRRFPSLKPSASCDSWLTVFHRWASDAISLQP